MLLGNAISGVSVGLSTMVDELVSGVFSRAARPHLQAINQGKNCMVKLATWHRQRQSRAAALHRSQSVGIDKGRHFQERQDRLHANSQPDECGGHRVYTWHDDRADPLRV